jgi:hypothetical protein
VDEPDGLQQRVLGREPGQRPDLVEAENLALVNRNRDLVTILTTTCGISGRSAKLGVTPVTGENASVPPSNSLNRPPSSAGLSCSSATGYPSPPSCSPSSR